MNEKLLLSISSDDVVLCLLIAIVIMIFVVYAQLIELIEDRYHSRCIKAYWTWERDFRQVEGVSSVEEFIALYTARHGWRFKNKWDFTGMSGIHHFQCSHAGLAWRGYALGDSLDAGLFSLHKSGTVHFYKVSCCKTWVMLNEPCLCGKSMIATPQIEPLAQESEAGYERS